MRLTPLAPGAPAALTDLRDGVQELAEPSYPHRVFACAAADLPPAADYPHCIAINKDTQKLVASTWDGAQWEWLTCDGGAL